MAKGNSREMTLKKKARDVRKKIDAMGSEWKTLKCKSGAVYKWKYDDHCIAVKIGNSKPVWIELQALQFFEAELSMREIPLGTANEAYMLGID